MSGDTHQIIDRFQQSAEMLDLQLSKENLDDAISLLAGSMEMSSRSLSEDDLAVLTRIGGILYGMACNAGVLEQPVPHAQETG